jgi:hypothetical protein
VNEAAEIQSDYVDASSYPSPSSSLSSSFAAPPQCHTDSCTCQRLNSESNGAGRRISSADCTVQAPTGQTGERHRSVDLGSGLLLALLPIDSRLCSFISCDVRLSLRGRNNGILHGVGSQWLMNDILRKLNPCHLLDHKHDIWVVAADLLRIL